MNNLIAKYSKQEKKEEIFHSSSYGRAQNQSSLGTTSTESFSQRKQVDHQRKVVRRYNESRIANSGTLNGPRPKKYTPPKSSYAGKPVPESPAKSKPLLPRNPKLTPLHAAKPAPSSAFHPSGPKH